MTKERFLELDSLLNRECHKYDDDCNTCPHKADCDEYSHTEYNSYNDICYSCKKWFDGCKDTTNPVWTGCVYREV